MDTHFMQCIHKFKCRSKINLKEARQTEQQSIIEISLYTIHVKNKSIVHMYCIRACVHMYVHIPYICMYMYI